ncbi:WD40-repeat-containing domain [Pseudocohnilembus persalinus]|uniref:WD40-repeat-containing domain n=1 Tax=Pseudocohnilembus persalinus TaxID=266149 RepID=A0A0V0QTV1_PSEPJ|nr:WD40-repeat-containing domain [Pseudocohnilembus persalinus]|eukprot:KRX05440.1 WD40-repeat-containing domain [Pseudocohnilembus persalinus]
MKRGVNIQNPESFYLISTRDHIYDNFDNLLKHRHPNSICFDRHGRLFAGDSLGSIHVFDLNNINDNSNQIQKLQTIEHQSIEGDPINQVHFINSDDLIVHSRDNCIRKFTIKGQSEKRVAASYIGSTAQKFPIHSRVSPSNEFILSGSEDGKPFLWDISGNLENTKTFEYDIQGALSDVAWSESYHMVAVAGFGSEFPIIVYYYEKMDNEVEQEYYKLQDQMDLREQREQKYDDDDGAPFLHDDRRV